MLDKSVKHLGVVMIRNNNGGYLKYRLPEGFTFVTFQEGDELEWAKIETSVEEFIGIDKALEHFKKEFGNQYEKVKERCIFIKDKHGQKIATAMAWEGQLQNSELPRVHWVAVKKDYQGIGLSKALITKILDLYKELGEKRNVYLTTQTWSYKAINIYKKFGFKPFDDMKRGKQEGVAGNFECDFNLAWNIINEKIEAYEEYKDVHIE